MIKVDLLHYALSRLNLTELMTFKKITLLYNKDNTIKRLILNDFINKNHTINHSKIINLHYQYLLKIK